MPILMRQSCAGGLRRRQPPMAACQRGRGSPWSPRLAAGGVPHDDEPLAAQRRPQVAAEQQQLVRVPVQAASAPALPGGGGRGGRVSRGEAGGNGQPGPLERRRETLHSGAWRRRCRVAQGLGRGLSALSAGPGGQRGGTEACPQAGRSGGARGSAWAAIRGGQPLLQWCALVRCAGCGIGRVKRLGRIVRRRRTWSRSTPHLVCACELCLHQRKACGGGRGSDFGRVRHAQQAVREPRHQQHQMAARI